MPEVVWYRSLYWRIALGFIVFLTLMLVVQGALFLWLVGRSAGSLPASSAARPCCRRPLSSVPAPR